jgi:hypothetical protein
MGRRAGLVGPAFFAGARLVAGASVVFADAAVFFAGAAVFFAGARVVVAFLAGACVVAGAAGSGVVPVSVAIAATVPCGR